VLAALAKLVAESGKEIRAAALEALGVVYTIEGEGERTEVAKARMAASVLNTDLVCLLVWWQFGSGICCLHT
jgi:hypothetical protein